MGLTCNRRPPKDSIKSNHPNLISRPIPRIVSVKDLPQSGNAPSALNIGIRHGAKQFMQPSDGGCIRVEGKRNVFASRPPSNWHSTVTSLTVSLRRHPKDALLGYILSFPSRVLSLQQQQQQNIKYLFENEVAISTIISRACNYDCCADSKRV
jgi:hypothetical protein